MATDGIELFDASALPEPGTTPDVTVVVITFNDASRLPRAIESVLGSHKLVTYLGDLGIALIEGDHSLPPRVPVALLVQELHKLGVGHLGLVHPEAIHRDRVLGYLLGVGLGIVPGAAHGQGSSRHVDHHHAVG